MKRAFVYVVSALLLLVIVMLVIDGRKPPAPWFSTVAAGNGYDALLQAAAQMSGKPPANETNVAAFLKANDRMFQLTHAALKMPFEVPEAMYSVTNSPLQDLASFKSLALSLVAKGEEARRQGALAESISSFVEVIQLGQRVEHGPLIALLVGIAIEKIGRDALEAVAPELTPQQRRDLAARLEAFDQERLPFEEVVRRERYFARQVAQNPIQLLVARVQTRAAIQKAEQKQQKLSSDFKRAAEALRR